MLNKYVEELLNYGIRKNMIEPVDKYVVRNEIFSLLGIDEPYLNSDLDVYDEPEEILSKIIYGALQNGLIEDSQVNKEILEAKIMSKLMPRQSELARTFYDILANEGEMAACDYFYELSKNSNYIRMDRVARNKYFTVDTDFGEMEITINLSKPEKDPKDIEAAKHAKASNYPKCFLCIENIGFEGRINHPARANHRVIPISLNAENWYLQYSPYVYYDEHAICFYEHHVDMKICRETFIRLCDFVEKFPHYFLGSNADLPLVGGSILSHDHFQGGNHIFALDKAESILEFASDDFKDVNFEFIKWPLSVIRISSTDKNKVIEASDYIFNHCKDYSDESLSILANSIDGEVITRHNTVTPIARMKDGKFVMNLALRNNRKSEDFPFGIFHPHEEIHHIKKENIGLIEVMGLAVLPKRLDDDNEIFVSVLSGVKDLNDLKDNHHYEWLKTLKEKYGKLNEDGAKKAVNYEIGQVFAEGLVHCGVFKQDENGKEGLIRFMKSMGFKEI